MDKDQAAIARSYIRGYFEAIPALNALLVRPPSTIELRNGVVIDVVANNFRSIRGRTLLAAIFDELAFCRDESFASPDVEIANAVAPGLARMPGSMCFMISSVHKRAGLLYQRVRDFHGKDDPDTLAIVGSTLQLNPSFDARIIERDLARDPERFGAEYLCRWRDDLSTWLGRDLLDAAVDPGVIVRPPVAVVKYIAAAAGMIVSPRRLRIVSWTGRLFSTWHLSGSRPRFPMCTVFPRSEYYQRIRLHTAASAFLRNVPYRPAYSAQVML